MRFGLCLCSKALYQVLVGSVIITIFILNACKLIKFTLKTTRNVHVHLSTIVLNTIITCTIKRILGVAYIKGILVCIYVFIL